MLAVEEVRFEMVFGWRKPRELLKVREKNSNFYDALLRAIFMEIFKVGLMK